LLKLFIKLKIVLKNADSHSRKLDDLVKYKSELVQDKQFQLKSLLSTDISSIIQTHYHHFDYRSFLNSDSSLKASSKLFLKILIENFANERMEYFNNKLSCIYYQNEKDLHCLNESICDFIEWKMRLIFLNRIDKYYLVKLNYKNEMLIQKNDDVNENTLAQVLNLIFNFILYNKRTIIIK
jgi:hypothetical protein